MHKNLHLLEIGRQVLIEDIRNADGTPRSLISAIIYGFADNKNRVNEEYEEGVSIGFFCGVDREAFSFGIARLGDDAIWEIPWICEIKEQVPTKEELLTHRCPQVRQLALRK